jgi:hypothetical protein
MLPSFLIVGTMKSGTSTLAHYLRQHPEIYIPNDEVHFSTEKGKENGVMEYNGMSDSLEKRQRRKYVERKLRHTRICRKFRNGFAKSCRLLS